MDQLHINYYKSAFDIEINQIKEKFETILDHAEKSNIGLGELNRNMKAVQWLNKTYGNNLSVYPAEIEDTTDGQV
jgi:hypothetical protein